MTEIISLRGVRTHNLKNIDVDIPRDQLVVITCLSGSGKSSLAFDTLYAEGQRRYVESLSAYARQFLSMMSKPDIDLISGLSPAISIEQKTTSHNPRSTVGTITEIYDYLRLLFARVGEPHCPTHNISLQACTVSQIADYIMTLPEQCSSMILAPAIRDRKGEHLELIQQWRSQGYVRLRIDGNLYEIDDLPSLNPRQKHTIEVVVDRFKIRSDILTRLSESLETALALTNGLVIIASMNNEFTEMLFSSKFACAECGYSLSSLEPRLFSFNSPMGACPSCDGIGFKAYNALAQIPEFKTCHDCHGARLRLEARHVYINGKNLPEITNYSIADAYVFFNSLSLPGKRGEIALKINKEIIERLGFLVNVGLNYLSLGRCAGTLSGGEAQRIRLASQIGSGLVGVMYILDEPSIGLHQRDNARLLKTLQRLRDLGNSVIVVEHDEEAILSADYVLDLGPGAGKHGGEVIAAGTPNDIKKTKLSLTGQYLSGVI